ncbi:MAG: 23S rRNA (pseudouridine(1915)-N(3))-methyltransferase RlmH [Clostridia bacterium]|nr:23S rRNA (pseudouridine(1915)-N(3))-methyltransferase RlmH [Clostridia bacterium]
MNLKIISVGNLKEKYLKDAVLEYSKRILAYCKFEITEIPEYKLPKNPSAAMILKAMEMEGDRISEKINKTDYTIALCIEGKQFSSIDFADLIKSASLKRSGSINFIIGSSFGLSESIKQMANLKLSLSQMTFAHQVVRVLLCEQIYRAFNILSGGKYHK